MDKEFIRVRSVKDIAISISLALLGAILLALPTSSSVNTAGFFMLIAGIILFLSLRGAYKETDSGKRFIKQELYFANDMMDELSEAMATDKPSSIDLAQEDKGRGIRLDIYYRKEDGKSYMQLFKYVPYKYEPCSIVYEYKLSQVTQLIK